MFHLNVASKYGKVFGDAATKKGSHIDNGFSLLPRYISKREDPGNEVVTFSSRKQGVLTICMGNPEISGKIQMARFILVEIFRIKRNTFRGITFFPFLPKRPKFSVPFVWITSARLQVERKRKIYRYFEKLKIQLNPVPVSGAQNKSQCHLTEIFR